MKHIPLKESLIWFALVVLTLVSYYTWDGGTLNKKTISAMILLVGGLKFSAIWYYYMELEHAHFFWKAGMTTMLIGTLTGIFVLL